MVSERYRLWLSGVNAEVPDEPEVQPEDGEEQYRQRTDVQVVQSREERRAGHEVRRQRSAERPDEAGSGDGVGERLAPFLIRPQNGPGEDEREDEQKKRDAGPPRDFAGTRVAASPEDVDQMNDDAHRDDRRRPVVQR